jgi:hypothetical protein
MALCAALGADPGEILFKQPAMGEIVKSSPSAAKAIKSAAAIGPQPAANSSRARSFKAKQRKLRRAFLR